MARRVSTGRRLTSGEIGKRFEQRAAEALVKPKAKWDRNEDALIDSIDDKALLGEMIEDFLPVFKRIRGLRDPDAQLEALATIAPMILGKTMMFGTAAEARGAANDVLNRVLGKPIERVQSMTMNVNNLSETEVDNELNRLFRKLGGPTTGDEAGGVEVVSEEGEDI